MAYEQRDDSGALFKNDKKQNERHPDYKGNAKINGNEMWVSAWLKKDRNGNTFMSLSFEEKGRRQEAPNREEADAGRDPDDSDMPF